MLKMGIQVPEGFLFIIFSIINIRPIDYAKNSSSVVRFKIDTVLWV